MKKILLLILSLSFMSIACTSCFGGTKDSASQESTATETASKEDEVKKTYKVTFRQFGQEDVVVEVKEGEDVPASSIPTPKDREGYTVVWKDVDLTEVGGDIMVESKETPNSYKITYNANGGQVAVKETTVIYDSVVTLVTPTYNDSFEFAGWYDEAGKSVVSGSIWKTASDVILTARWNPVQITKYPVVYKQEGCAPVTVYIKEGETISASDIPSVVPVTGYTVVWDKDLAGVPITGTTEVNAVLTANKYTITYDADGGTASKENQQVTFDSPVDEMATATKDGYKFKGWYDGTTLITEKTVWKKDGGATLKAAWEEDVPPAPDYVTITFVNGLTGEEISEVEIVEGTALTTAQVPALPAQDGYTFAWDKDITVAFAENTTITADATPCTYTLTLDAQGGTVTPASKTVTYGQAIGELPVPTKTKYEFLGWLDSEGKSVTKDTLWTKASDGTLTADWKEIIVYYTVTFVQNGQESKEYTVKEGTAFIDSHDMPMPATKTGYEVKWNETEVAALSSVNSNLTVNAVETAKTYTITFSDAKGKITGTQTVWFDRDYDFSPDVTLVGYTFDKYTLDGAKVDQKGKWMKDSESKAFTLVVVWKANTYTVTLNSNGGTCAKESIDVIYDAAYELPEPTRSGYKFAGWYQGTTKVDLSGDAWKYTGADGQISLVASWTKNGDEDGDWTKNY